MMNGNNSFEEDFHAVDFMWKVRSELSEKYLKNKDQYLRDLKKAMDDFKCKQEKAKQSV